MSLKNELCKLENKYIKKEEDELSITHVPEGKYLCIRVDGFKATKNHLRDNLINKKFTEAMNKANKVLFYSFRNYLTKEYSSSIIASYIINDEISIILNKDNNGFDSRIMKTATLFSGLVSSSFTLNFKIKKALTFDARPIILSKNEISEYIRYRYLMAKRYANWKVLRLKSVDGKFDDKYNIFSDNIKKDIDNAIKIVEEYNLFKEVEMLISTYSLYITQAKQKPDMTEYNISSATMTLEKISEYISKYLKYLHTTKKN